MKMIFQTSAGQTCFIRVPNFFDYEQVPELLSRARTVIDEQIIDESVILHGDDWLTNDEHKQLDIYGRIANPMREICL